MPLDITQFEANMQDFSLLMMLLDDYEHENVKSLTEDTVARLDLLAKRMKLDGENAWKYFARSRYNDETGN